MTPWDQQAASIVETPGVLTVWPNAGLCHRCNQPLAAAMVDLKALKALIATALEEASKGAVKP